jgi:hypothetical protein
MKVCAPALSLYDDEAGFSGSQDRAARSLPRCRVRRRGWATIRTSTSLISSGTERMLVEFGKAG